MISRVFAFRLDETFEALAAFCVRRANLVLAAAFLSALVGIALAAARLDLKTSNLDLVDPSLPEVQRFLRFADEFGTPNQLIVVLEGTDPKKLRRAAEEVAGSLQGAPGVRAVLHRKPFDLEGMEILGIDPYFTSRGGGMLFAFVQPSDRSSSAATLAPFVQGVRERLVGSHLERFGVSFGLTGMPQYALDDRDIIQGDISRLSFLSLVVICLLFITAFGALRRPLAATAALLVGVCWTAGLTAFFPGYLTLLSAFFAAILFGLGVDYGIHIIDRVEERVASGMSEAEAIPPALGSLARPLSAGAGTTAAVLFTLAASGFKGFAELGRIAGFGILFCLLAMVTVLPALLARFAPRQAAGRKGERPLEQRRLGRWLMRLQGRPTALVVGAAALAGLAVAPPAFDANYLNLQPEGSEAAELERRMIEGSDLAPMFAVFVTPEMARLKELAWLLSDESSVGSIHSILDLNAFPGAFEALPEDQKRALESPSGLYALYAFPAEDIWQPEAQQVFLDRMRRLDAEVTGMPFLGAFMVERSRRAMRISAALSSLALLILVFLDFRRPLPALLALTPTLLTVPAIAGAMRLFGVSWNPIDVMAVPVILGIAVDNGIHLVHRFLHEAGDLRRTLAGAGRSVVLTSGTTLAAFGALILTRHRGLASFAQVMSLGIGAALLLSVLVLPQLLEALKRPLLRSSS
ncbi:MAG: MMPL family transporter [Acidobacteria bacterium]|nr:MMPL family transporter [Acidobacteriota bacterium]